MVEIIDQWAAISEVPVFCQIGPSKLKLKNCTYKPFLDQNEYKLMMVKCSVVVAHAGIGSILSALEYKKPIIIFRVGVKASYIHFDCIIPRRICYKLSFLDDKRELRILTNLPTDRLRALPSRCDPCPDDHSIGERVPRSHPMVKGSLCCIKSLFGALMIQWQTLITFPIPKIYHRKDRSKKDHNK